MVADCAAADGDGLGPDDRGEVADDGAVGVGGEAVALGHGPVLDLNHD